jgi:DNA-binding NarL/FixJ family response regulator
MKPISETTREELAVFANRATARRDALTTVLAVHPAWLETATPRRDAVARRRLAVISPAIRELAEFTDNWQMLDTLSPSQLNVVLALGTAQTYREMAERLYLSENTIKNHLNEIRKTLGMTEKSAGSYRLVALAVRYMLERRSEVTA